MANTSSTPLIERLGEGTGFEGKSKFFDYVGHSGKGKPGRAFGYIEVEGEKDNIRYVLPSFANDVTFAQIKAMEDVPVTFEVTELHDRLVVSNVRPVADTDES